MKPPASRLPSGRFRAVAIDPEACTGCNRCAELCPMDVLAESLEPRSPPAVAYPEECWFCGCCAAACPVGAVRVVIPLPMRVSVWKGAER